jgi:hypothetical protein
MTPSSQKMESPVNPGRFTIVTGYLLVRLPIKPASSKAIAWQALAGIFAELLFGLTPALVIIGVISMTLAMVRFGLWRLRMRTVVPGR